MNDDASNRPLALVIGGANGIGAACCRVMKARGWRVLIADRDREACEQLAGELDAAAFAADVCDLAALRALDDTIAARHGCLDALIVSSGVFQQNLPAEHAPYDTPGPLLDVNVGGTWRCNRVFGLRMARRRRGSIVNVASVTAHGSTPLNVYGPSKAAIVNMTQSFAGEWGHSGVRVNSVSPGITLVPRIRARKREGRRYPADIDAQMALGRCVEPDEVAEAIEFLASARASAITGVDLVVDCGWLTGSLWHAYGGLRTPVGETGDASEHEGDTR